MSASTTNNSADSSTQDKEEEVLKNAATTNEQQPPNKFLSNTKKVSGKPLPVGKTRTAKISHGISEPNKQNTSKNFKKDSTTKNFAQLKGQKGDLEADKMESSRSSQQLEDFSKKKEERDREIMEIQEMLNKMKSPQKCSLQSSQESEKEEDSPKEAEESVTTKKTEAEKENSKTENKDIPFYGRCKTELQLMTKPVESANSRVARRDTVRSGSSTAATLKTRSRSSQWPLSVKETKTNKKISYNPEEARRYMEMQRKQRKLDLHKDPSIKSKIEKEEIRKRLEELKSSTRKLIAKNIQKKEKCVGENVTNKETESEIITQLREPEQDKQPIKQTNEPPIQLRAQKEQERVSSRNSVTQRNKMECTVQESSYRSISSQGVGNVLKPAAVSLFQNHKRIGLLRKTESDKDFSFTSHRNYNFDKENHTLEMLTKQLMKPQHNKAHKDKYNTQGKELDEYQKENEVKDTETQAEDKQKSDLELSENNSKPNRSKEKKEPSLDNLQKEAPKPSELPYWLRPSATQVYPYNFIMAVRRKLESLVQPVATRKPAYDEKQNQETSTTDLNSQSRQMKRKSLELLDEKHRKKIRRKQEDAKENVLERSLKELSIIKESTLKQLKPLPQDIQFNKYENNKQHKKEYNKDDESISEVEAKSKIQFKHVQKSLQSVEFNDIKHINKTKVCSQTTPLKALDKSLKSLSSDQEDNKQNLQQFKLPTNYKSMESLNSEINSNISSISLPVPISNTLTEVSSLKTESRRTYTNSAKQQLTQSEDEVASLSSEVFSSPETELSKAQKEFEFVKPRPVSPLSLEKVDKLKIERKQTDKEANKNDDKEVYFTQLLEDFNRSLSQVIQVNEQLKCSVDKSQQILSPHSSKKSIETNKHYSSDFEKSSTVIFSSKQNERLQQSLQKSNANLKERKRQLFEIAEKVKPLLTPQKSEDDKEHKMISNDKEKHRYPNFNLSLKSFTNSNASTEEEEHKTPQSGFEEEEQITSSIASQCYEERFYEIEKLKETLKQTILESKRKRKEKEQWLENSSEKQKSNNNTTEIESLKHNRPNQSKTESIDSSASNKEILNNSYNEYKIFENYEKQHKNNESLKTSYSENDKNKLQEHEAINKNNHAFHHYSSNEILQLNAAHNSSHNHHFVEKNQQMNLSYSTFHSKTNSNTVSSQQRDNQTLQNDNNSPSYKQRKENVRGTDTESNSATQTEVDITTQYRDDAKSKSVTKTNKSEDAISTSITEELQKTYESGSNDNENIPLNSNTKSHTSKSLNKYNDSAQFIKSHINRSRGDFQENISKAANETQLQEAIDAASQISSTEFAQSADDEITSSVASKPYFKGGPNRCSSYNARASGSMSSKQFLSTFSPPKAIGSEIVRFFTQYDSERSERRHSAINDSMSESSLNYSNVGLYEKLIQNETNKSQHLTALLKMREKALLDRTKGQIAWLEVQKARYKAKGLINHIAAIKKKQRGILLKMEKEHEEIKRLLYSTTANNRKPATAQTLQTGGHKINSQEITPTKHKKERLPSTATPLTKSKVLGQHLTVKTKNIQVTSPILRATYELESSWAVEELLKKREDDLRKRREHVERLIQWHQRLDEEEAEVLSLERRLLNYNNVPHMVEQQQSKLPTATTSAIKEKLTTPATAAISTISHEQGNVPAIKTPEKIRASRARKMERRLKEIDKSLKELSHISDTSTTSGIMGQSHNDKEDSVSTVATQELEFVRTTGLKLNKLWKRLTSQQIEKFEPTRRYKLCKSDLERLYEEAKMAVLRDFAQDEERIAKELLEKSASNLSTTTSVAGQVDLPAATDDDKIIDVPMLNLNFSSGHSEPEEESANNSQHNTTQQGNYSPSVAEQNFKARVLLNSSASSDTASEQQMPAEEKQSSRLENNVQMFLALSQRMQACAGGKRLQRSLSDTEISDVPKYKADKTTTSQQNIETIASHSNSSITTNSSARSVDASAQHQRSKSSTWEITYIPSTATQTNCTDISQITKHHADNLQGNRHKEAQKDVEQVNQLSNHQSTIRSSVICSVGAIKPLESCQHTSSDIVTITEDSKTTTKVSNVSQKSTYSGQVGTNSETTAQEISSKLDEISAAVTQLSQMNALPSYESVITHSHSKYNSIDVPTLNTNDESNLSTDASSYSFNFENITTDKHSSPGTSSLNSYSLQHKAVASKTYTKEDISDHKELKESSSASPSHIHTGASTSLNSITSKTFAKDDTRTSSNTLTQSVLENRILDTYEADFESDLSNVTHIEDITIPNFETTVETTQDDDADQDDVELSSKLTNAVKDQEENISTNVSDKTYNAEELKKSLSSSDSEKSLSKTDLKSHKPALDKELLPPPPPLSSPPPPPLTSLSATTAATTSGASIATTLNQTGSNHLMPDIINELELRRHQLLLDNEHLKQYEHVTAVPYMYVREIPNKPPPPYVPPAHGSPMTTIFPSEDRIKDITFRRAHELYCELLKTEYCNEKGEKLPSVMEEQITNIYERIILDICREYLEEHGEILRDGDPTNFHSQLAFFNPPNRLRCIQDAIYKEVRTCLAMVKTQPKRTQIYSVYGQRAKQDHIGKIIMQEMYDEDDRWCNFHREESEVLHLMVEEMINKNIVVTVKEVFLEEGGTIDDDEKQAVEEEGTIAEENAANHQVEETSIFEECTEEEKRQQQTQLQTSSVLVETLNDDDKTYCVNESKQDYKVLNQTTRIEPEHQKESIQNASINGSTNAVQTCT